MKSVTKYRIGAGIILLAAVLVGYFVLSTQSEDSRFRLHYGLDLSGGTHLVYKADVSQVAESEIDDAMASLRSVIERRVNAFGVSEPNVQVETGGFGGETEHRLIVELPEVTDVNEALRVIGETPLLEFKLQGAQSVSVDEEGTAVIDATSQNYTDTGLNGRFLKRASLQFGSGQNTFSNEPIIAVEFNSEGADLFEQITTEHTGEILYILLDGEVISDPRINEPIAGGQAVITGTFSPEEAKALVRNLNFGALPVPIELESTQTIGATLGAEARDAGMLAGIIGLLIVALFLILWYRLPGLIGVFALGFYLLIMVSLFKLIPVVLTSAGIAGFILSIGMAVDANILIFERMKEEFGHHEGKMQDAITSGFSRAWPSIRDGNLSSIFTAIILYWAGTTLTKGFAVTWGLGIIVSMFTAITISRTLLLALGAEALTPTRKFLYGIGFSNAKSPEEVKGENA